MNHQMAQHIQSQGRGDDSVLVHMTPGEVSGLQALAMAHGGSLTINPETGLAEAGWLGKLLPTILGAAGMAFGIPPIWMGALGAVGGTAITGDLKQGLMAGLGAFGGASLAGAAGLGNIAGNVGAKLGLPGAVSKVAGATGIVPGGAAGAIPSATTATAALPAGLGPGGASLAGTGGLGAGIGNTIGSTSGSLLNAGVGASPSLFGAANVGAGITGAAGNLVVPTSEIAASLVPQGAAAAGTAAAKTGLAGFAQRFGDAAKAGLPAGTPGFVAKAAPLLAASGVVNSISGALTPSGGVAGPSGQIDNSYQGPYFAQDRQRILDPEGPLTSRQRRHFAVAMPEIYNTMGQVTQPGSNTVRGTQIMQPVLNPKAKKGQPMYSFVPITYQGGIEPNPGSYTGYARGGEIELADGAFVVDARTVSEIGNGSSNAGIEALRRLGGRPVQGRGDGVSDSVPARIGKRQPARVARDEVIIPADAVRRLGKGNPKRGADKLYALMNKAHKARKKAGRGQDTKLRRGLA
jgi:hypothetical protein